MSPFALHPVGDLKTLGARVTAVFAGAASVCGLVAAQGVPPAPMMPPPVWTYEYDAVGNLLRRTQPQAAAPLVTHQQFDALGRLQTQTDPDGGVTRFRRNGRGAITQVVDPIGVATDYILDGFDQAVFETSPDGGTRTRRHDAHGRLVSERDARGVDSTFHYDVLGRLRLLNRVDGGVEPQVFRWDYDASSNGYGVGRMTGSYAPGVGTNHFYDPLGRVAVQSRTVQVPNVSAPLVHSIEYAWDTSDRLQSVGYPSGRLLQYRTDPTGVVRSLDLTGPAGTSNLMSQIDWEPFGPPRGWRWGHAGQALHAIERDSSGRVVRHPLGPWLRDIHYDTADRVTALLHRDAVTGALSAGLNQSYTYDRAGRLTNWVLGTTLNVAVGYDANGNRTWLRRNGQTTWLGRQTGTNRLSILAEPMRTAQYDDAGNLVGTSAGQTLSYDASGRLSAVSSATVQATFRYDERQRRLYSSVTQWVPSPQPPTPPVPPPASGSAAGMQTEAGFLAQGATEVENAGLGETTTAMSTPSGIPVTVTTVFMYDVHDRLIGEYSGSDGAPQREYFWLDDMLVAMAVYTRSAGSGWTPQSLQQTLFFVHSDHLNTPRVVLDEQGRQRWTWRVDPFGMLSPNTNPSGLGNFTFNLRMPGQYRDDAIGLSYNWHRFYDAGNGRYIQSDPIGLAGGINTYAYAENQPTRFTDPEGLSTYVCRRPLGGRPGSYAPPLLNHTYVCVSNGAGRMVCGSTTASTEGTLLNVTQGSRGVPTPPSKDYFSRDACDQRWGDDSCIESCVANELAKPTRNWYGVGPAGEDCQEYTWRILHMCEKRCARR